MSQSDTSPVLLAESQVEIGAELFARVFRNAPDMKYLIGDNTRIQDQTILHYYQSIIRIGLLDGEVYTTPNLDGVAVWVSPENAQLNLGILFRTGFLKAILQMGLRPLGRFIRSASYLDNLQKQAISGPCWILVLLGVEPSKQGKGIGGMLIQPILACADAEGVSCYVESADERNLGFYKRQGFAIVKHGQVPKGGPEVWVMVRE
jgi:GNAT superfamily N-acetyltransferase